MLKKADFSYVNHCFQYHIYTRSFRIDAPNIPAAKNKLHTLVFGLNQWGEIYGYLSSDLLKVITDYVLFHWLALVIYFWNSLFRHQGENLRAWGSSPSRQPLTLACQKIIPSQKVYACQQWKKFERQTIKDLKKLNSV